MRVSLRLSQSCFYFIFQWSSVFVWSVSDSFTGTQWDAHYWFQRHRADHYSKRRLLTAPTDFNSNLPCSFEDIIQVRNQQTSNWPNFIYFSEDVSELMGNYLSNPRQSTGLIFLVLHTLVGIEFWRKMVIIPWMFLPKTQIRKFHCTDII